MNLALVLNLVIPTVIICYAIYLIVHMIKNSKRGCSCGGCSSCPMADSCRTIRKKEQKEKQKNEP